MPVDAAGAITTRSFQDGALATEGFPLADVPEHVRRPGTIVWVDLLRPDAAALEALGESLGLHELAMEDALEPHQRPKLDVYDSHLFLSARAVGISTDTHEMHETEVDVFVDTDWIITVRNNDRFTPDQVVHRLGHFPELSEHGATFILHALLDAIVDDYFDVIQVFDDFYDQVSEGLFHDHPVEPSQQRDWFEMRRALVRFHRLAVPMHESVSGLLRRGDAVLPDDLRPYFQDVYDHVLRVSEATDSLRDLVATIVDTNLSLRDYRQNQIMKQITSWAAIVAVPTLITGFYGMNVPYPGSGRTVGVIVSMALMVVISLLLYVQFRRRDWI